MVTVEKAERIVLVFGQLHCKRMHLSQRQGKVGEIVVGTAKEVVSTHLFIGEDVTLLSGP